MISPPMPHRSPRLKAIVHPRGDEDDLHEDVAADHAVWCEAKRVLRQLLKRPGRSENRSVTAGGASMRIAWPAEWPPEPTSDELP